MMATCLVLRGQMPLGFISILQSSLRRAIEARVRSWWCRGITLSASRRFSGPSSSYQHLPPVSKHHLDRICRGKVLLQGPLLVNLIYNMQNLVPPLPLLTDPIRSFRLLQNWAAQLGFGVPSLHTHADLRALRSSSCHASNAITRSAPDAIGART